MLGLALEKFVGLRSRRERKTEHRRLYPQAVDRLDALKCGRERDGGNSATAWGPRRINFYWGRRLTGYIAVDKGVDPAAGIGTTPSTITACASGNLTNTIAVQRTAGNYDRLPHLLARVQRDLDEVRLIGQLMPLLQDHK